MKHVDSTTRNPEIGRPILFPSVGKRVGLTKIGCYQLSSVSDGWVKEFEFTWGCGHHRLPPFPKRWERMGTHIVC